MLLEDTVLMVQANNLGICRHLVQGHAVGHTDTTRGFCGATGVAIAEDRIGGGGSLWRQLEAGFPSTRPELAKVNEPCGCGHSLCGLVRMQAFRLIVIDHNNYWPMGCQDLGIAITLCRVVGQVCAERYEGHLKPHGRKEDAVPRIPSPHPCGNDWLCRCGKSWGQNTCQPFRRFAQLCVTQPHRQWRRPSTHGASLRPNRPPSSRNRYSIHRCQRATSTACMVTEDVEKRCGHG
mmetsp:Transcript_22964/g.65093  ORF Transcript_22964/g.65093 Transcript_22964/m.65093 type:complete len:235 (+) Transcript_22964:97-801(+)